MVRKITLNSFYVVRSVLLFSLLQMILGHSPRILFMSRYNSLRSMISKFSSFEK